MADAMCVCGHGKHADHWRDRYKVYDCAAKGCDCTQYRPAPGRLDEAVDAVIKLAVSDPVPTATVPPAPDLAALLREGEELLSYYRAPAYMGTEPQTAAWIASTLAALRGRAEDAARAEGASGGYPTPDEQAALDEIHQRGVTPLSKPLRKLEGAAE